ncbi:MAG TPA: hypothetical protein VJL84_00905 [Kiloniellales bacterium]|nr:hypothetical protein [Kiloniellales bacterium]
MKARFAAALALVLLPLPLAAQEPADPEFTLGQYQALSEADRTLYVAGLSDMLDAAAAMAPDNTHLPPIAGCTHGYGRDDLRSAAEEGAAHIKMKWSENAPAASWFVTTMIHVCQLQLPPPGQ